MKLLTVNFLTCAVKACKGSPSAFPLHFRDVELELQDVDFQPDFIRNIIPRVDWEALHKMANELNFPNVPETKPEGEVLESEQLLRDLHRFLLETQVAEGKLTCGNCGHEYIIKEGIANFLLPSHLGSSPCPAPLPLVSRDAR
ncbi:hypothetical protein ASPSYDRAFT_148971 [Aspergillus sydowii CBS 593.65]|uniref:Multifunctional methyltransferase subunit trm112 n=1 Tax=Aspergillus sydowii CBS 593.65 TaxID=1036612 RepID=A0A1L9TIP1_9EURO|nr:uncharacterized protein ASPSYDRAFT_148971 [Aspergillus sydowii CBS 593.65]OJJ59290.1 hypothetical protein ASPSYDRAFT_148971 [Aspergillus sydowii CBS 593.65]